MNKLIHFFKKNIDDIIHYEKNEGIELVIKTVFETLLSHEREEFLANDSSFNNKANGYYARLAKGINSYFRLKVPRDRLGFFKPVFLDVIKHQDEKMLDLAFKLYVKGLTTREIEDIFVDVFDKKLSRTSISNITKNFEEERQNWLCRPLEDKYYFLFIDAIFIPVRRDTVQKEPFYIVIGVKEDLKREILGVYNFPQETSEGWREVFKDLKTRNFKETLMVVADGLTGLDIAIKEELPGALLQRCLLHKMRNILIRIRSKDKKEVMEDFKNILKIGNPMYSIEEAKIYLNKFLNKWKKSYPYLGLLFKENELSYYFNYLKFPYQIQKMIYTTNWIERLNREIRRTQRFRCSFPNVESALNLICARLFDFEERVYKYPITAFAGAKNELNGMF